MELVSFIKDLIVKVMVIAWFTFFLTWLIGWAIKGSPIPFSKVRRVGQGLVEDAVWAALWLALGSTIFWFVSYIAGA
ncbi:MAG: hypothetical protein DRO12_04485, partial [Thermoprotei archaeon]